VHEVQKGLSDLFYIKSFIIFLIRVHKQRREGKVTLIQIYMWYLSQLDELVQSVTQFFNLILRELALVGTIN